MMRGHSIRIAALLGVFVSTLGMSGCIVGPDRGFGHGSHQGDSNGAQRDGRRGEHQGDDRQRGCDPRDKDCQRDHSDSH